MFLYNQKPVGTRFFYLFILITAMAGCLFSVLPASVWAQGNPFVVEDVEVDITADNAVQAREQAFEAAQIKAYEKLAKTLLDEQEFANFVTPDLNSISAMVKDFEVTDERLSAVRYNATYTIRFREHNLGGQSTQYMQPATNDPVPMKVEGETLILPVIMRDGRQYLWSEGPYFDAWKTAIQNDSSARYILPLGDIQDRTSLRDDEILTYDYARLKRMMDRYGASKAMIVVSNPQAVLPPNAASDVSVYHVKKTGPVLVKNTRVPIYPGETYEELFPRLVSQSKIIMNNAVAAMPRPVEPIAPSISPSNIAANNNLTAQVEFNSVREWINVKNLLQRVPSIKNIDVQSMSARAATIRISYAGDPTSLTAELMRARMRLDASSANMYGYGQNVIYKIQPIQ